MTNEDQNKKFGDLVKGLQEIRGFMKQKEIACDFEGNRILVVGDEDQPAYSGSDSGCDGFMGLFPTSNKIPKFKKIMDILPDLKIIRIRSI